MVIKYEDRVQFYLVYCREAHAIDSDWPAGSNQVEQPVSTEERRKVAARFLDDMDLDVPALLDNIDDKTSEDYASHPDRLYLVGKNGKIAFAGDKGPSGFKPDLLEAAIQQELDGKSTEGSSQSSGNSSPRTGQPSRGSRFMQMPIMAALDADKDGKISASEIEKSVAALKALDKDNDGKLTPQEFMRPPNRGR